MRKVEIIEGGDTTMTIEQVFSGFSIALFFVIVAEIALCLAVLLGGAIALAFLKASRFLHIRITTEQWFRKPSPATNPEEVKQ